MKQCIECQYAEGKGCSAIQTGQFICCADGSKCPTVPNSLGKKDYYLQYSVSYTVDVNAIKPVHMYLLDASNCKVEYNIEENLASPVRFTQLSWKAPVTGDVVFAAGHVHLGALNISMSLNGVQKCLTLPTYGTKVSQPGNEKGYLVAVNTCTDKFRVNAGDKLTVRSNYWVGGPEPSGRMLDGGGGFHGGVMSYMYLAYSTLTMTDAAGQRVADPRLVKWEPIDDEAFGFNA